MRPLVVVLLVLGAFVSGCVQHAAGVQGSADVQPAGAKPPSGSPGGGTTKAPSTTLHQTSPHQEKLEGDASFTFAVSNADGGTIGQFELAKFVTHEGHPTKATLVATWTSTTPLDDRLMLGLDGNGPRTSGPSPLTLDVTKDMATPGEILAFISAPEPGVAVHEAAHLVLTLDYA